MGLRLPLLMKMVSFVLQSTFYYTLYFESIPFLGQVIVGSVDGNRLWSKEIGSHLAAVTWSTDSSLLLFGLTDGEVHAYDLGGNFVLKVPMICIDSVELEAALSKDLKKDVIVSMEWFVPAFPCRDSDTRTIVDGGQLEILCCIFTKKI